MSLLVPDCLFPCWASGGLVDCGLPAVGAFWDGLVPPRFWCRYHIFPGSPERALGLDDALLLHAAASSGRCCHILSDGGRGPVACPRPPARAFVLTDAVSGSVRPVFYKCWLHSPGLAGLCREVPLPHAAAMEVMGS